MNPSHSKNKLKILSALSKSSAFTVSELTALTTLFESLCAHASARDNTAAKDVPLLPLPSLPAPPLSTATGGALMVKKGRIAGVGVPFMASSGGVNLGGGGGILDLTLDLTGMRSFLHNTFDITQEPLLDRIFRALCRPGEHSLGLVEFLNGMEVFLNRCRPADRLKYCFAVYDLNGDGVLSKEEMLHFLKDSLNLGGASGGGGADEEAEEGAKELVEVTGKLLDKDGDGKISFEDYAMAATEQPLLMEVLGPVLPDERIKDAFLATFAEVSPFDFGMTANV